MSTAAASAVAPSVARDAGYYEAAFRVLGQRFTMTGTEHVPRRGGVLLAYNHVGYVDFVYGGLVFQTLTRDYLTTWDKWWNKAPKEFLNYYYLGYRTAEQTYALEPGSERRLAVQIADTSVRDC